MTSEITSDANAGPQLVIWGTDVVVSHCKEKFRRFISKFVDRNVEEDEAFEGMDISQPYYMQRLDEVGLREACIHLIAVIQNLFKLSDSTKPLWPHVSCNYLCVKDSKMMGHFQNLRDIKVYVVFNKNINIYNKFSLFMWGYL